MIYISSLCDTDSQSYFILRQNVILSNYTFIVDWLNEHSFFVILAREDGFYFISKETCQSTRFHSGGIYDE